MAFSANEKHNSGYGFTLRSVLDILSDIDTDYASECARYIRDMDYLKALQMPFPNHENYDGLEDFRSDYLVYNLLRKNEFLELGIDKVKVAEEAFLESEVSCKHMNDFGRMYRAEYRITKHSLEAKIFKARELIRSALGTFDWNRASENFGFSSGASTRLRKKAGSPFYKFQGKPEVTPGAKLLATIEIGRTPRWRLSALHANAVHSDGTAIAPHEWTTTVAGSRADTVPKSWKTDRFICVEPDMNMYLQRGIGGVIRRKLRAVGIDLNSQEYNQYLAWIGSRTGSLSTIDLKAASDSISIELVRMLLPDDWFAAIFATRSHYTLFRGKWLKLEKISSMGNGYTFELESLIFWALSKAVLVLEEVADHRLAVYGDDIVIHNSAAAGLIELLSYVGFETNTEKTFVTGPFRESCGKHFFLGEDVSPFNIKGAVESESRFYWLLNSYNSWCTRGSRVSRKGRKSLLRRGRKFTKRYCVVPPGYGFDAGIETPIEYANIIWSLRKQQYMFKCLRAVRVIHKPNGVHAQLWWLSHGESPERALELHKGEPIYKRFNACTSRWTA